MSDQLPASIEPIGNLVPDIGVRGLPPSLQILLNEGLYDRIKQLSVVMSRAKGMTPAHLLDKPEACFAIINMALDWKLSPHFVARHTYQTPGGQIGFDGALVQAALEQSGKFVGSPALEYRGDWQTLTGKFEVKEGQRGGKYAVPTWTTKDATGLGVIVRWQVKGEQNARVWPGESDPFWLTQCYPLNSPLWATDAKTQIAYLAIRRFANLTSPGILGAAAFDQDDLIDASERAVDVTEPRRQEPRREQPEPIDDRPEFVVIDSEGQEFVFREAVKASSALMALLRDAATLELLDGVWESNQPALEQLGASELPHDVNVLAQEYTDLRDKLATLAATAQPQGAPQASEAVDPAKGPESREQAPSAPAAAPPAEARPSRRIPPTMRNGKADWRTWTVGLFQPKLRQMKSSNDLADLLGDNAENLEQARAPGALDAEVLRELEARIAEQWKVAQPDG